jgi:hypothetical protein
MPSERESVCTKTRHVPHCTFILRFNARPTQREQSGFNGRDTCIRLMFPLSACCRSCSMKQFVTDESCFYELNVLCSRDGCVVHNLAPCYMPSYAEQFHAAHAILLRHSVENVNFSLTHARAFTDYISDVVSLTNGLRLDTFQQPESLSRVWVKV